MRAQKLIFTLHLVLGLSVGLLLASAGVSGSVLVWRHEIDRALHPELLRVAPAAERLPVEAVLAAARAHDPADAALRVRMPRAPGESAEVVTAGGRQVYVDPYRGTVLGARGVDETFANALFDWHAHLLSGETGERVMGVVALLTVLLAASGLVVWWPGLRRLGPAVRVAWRANWKRVNYDVHRAVGFWTALFLVAAGVTGASLVFHDAFMAGLDAATRSPARPAVPTVEPVEGAPALPVARLLARAEAALPGGIVTYVALPQSPTAPVTVRRKMDAERHPNGRGFVYLHPQTGAVLAVQDPLRAPAGTRAYDVLYPIHVGRWGGTSTRVLWTVLGLSPLALFVSGALMWRNRTRKKPRKPKPARKVPSPRRRVPAAR